MIRRVTEHKKRNYDNEELMVVTVYEEGVKKKDTKDTLSKKHQFLVKRGSHFKLIEEKS